MAHGDEVFIEFGNLRGYTRRSIDIASATSHDLITPTAGNTIRVARATLTVEGDATEAHLKEEDNAVLLYGPVNVVSGTTAAVISLDLDDGIQTTTISKKLQMTLSVAKGVSGTIVYKEIT